MDLLFWSLFIGLFLIIGVPIFLLSGMVKNQKYNGTTLLPHQRGQRLFSAPRVPYSRENVEVMKLSLFWAIFGGSFSFLATQSNPNFPDIWVIPIVICTVIAVFMAVFYYFKRETDNLNRYTYRYDVHTNFFTLIRSDGTVLEEVSFDGIHRVIPHQQTLTLVLIRKNAYTGVMKLTREKDFVTYSDGRSVVEERAIRMTLLEKPEQAIADFEEYFLNSAKQIADEIKEKQMSTAEHVIQSEADKNVFNYEQQNNIKQQRKALKQDKAFYEEIKRKRSGLHQLIAWLTPVAILGWVGYLFGNIFGIIENGYIFESVGVLGLWVIIFVRMESRLQEELFQKRGLGLNKQEAGLERAMLNVAFAIPIVFIAIPFFLR